MNRITSGTIDFAMFVAYIKFYPRDLYYEQKDNVIRLRMISRIPKSSIFKRLLAVFIIITIPLFVIVLIFYQRNEESLEKELISTMNAPIYYYLHNMELEYQRAENIQYDLIDDDDLNQLATISSYMSDYTKTTTIRSLQDKLTIIKNSSSYIQEASVYIPSISRVLSASGGTRTIINGYPDNFVNTVQKSFIDMHGKTIFFHNQISVFMLYPPRLDPVVNPPLFVSEIVLSKSKIKKDLDGLNSYKDGGFFVFDSEGKNLISSGNNTGVPEHIRNAIGNSASGRKSITVDGVTYMAVYRTSSDMSLTMVNYTDENPVLSPIRDNQRWLWLILFGFLVVIIIYVYVIIKYINEPITVMIDNFKLLEKGDLEVKIDYQPRDEFKVLYRQFNSMVDKLNKLIVQVHMHTIFSQRAELKQLQAQINPHFLYNTYFLLHRLIKKGDPNALEISRCLGSYFEFITKNTSDNVSLKDEVNHARIYANMQAIRFSKRINVGFDELPEEISNVYVPRLILQPLLENAFGHGLEDKQENGLLHVGFHVEDTAFIISVEDNGKGLSPDERNRILESTKSDDKMKEYTGVVNIHRRLQLAFGEESGLRFTAPPSGGLRVDMVVTYKKGDEIA